MILTLTWWPRRRRGTTDFTTERTIQHVQLSISRWILIADLEPLTKRFREAAEGDQAGGQVEEALMHLGKFFVAQLQSSELTVPRQRPFHPPTVTPQPVFCFVSLGDLWNHSPTQQFVPQPPRVIRLVCADAPGASLRSPHAPAYAGNRVDQRKQLTTVMHIRRRHLGDKRCPLAIRGDVMLDSRFASIGRVGTGVRPPKTARVEELSIRHRDQSSSPQWCSLDNSTACNFGQTPAAFQSRSRRQQVMPDIPNCGGSSSQGMPVLRTNRIASSTARWGFGLRPSRKVRRDFWGGSKGSTKAHNSSLSSSRAMKVPPWTNPLSQIHVSMARLFC